MSKIYLFNSLSGKKEEFVPIKKNRTKIYTCGPTVYDYAHIGNFRSFVFADILVRVMKLNGFFVRHVENITDVGHLTDDADSGEDKLEKAATEKKKTAQEIAEFYTKKFIEDSKKLNLLSPNIRPRASEHIAEQIEIIKNLEKQGLTYKTKDGIYFDTQKYPSYGVFSRSLKEGHEEERIQKNPEKKSLHDFALWKFSPKDKTRHMEWDSPWGIGFPGWHIECSAMSYKYLSFPFDVHTGGIDHKPIHHENEIAQNDSFFGKKSVQYWLHNEFVIVDGKKMSKSLGNLYTLDDIEKKGFSPLHLRYLYLLTHYRQPLQFSWDALLSGKNAYENLKSHLGRIVQEESLLTRFAFRFKEVKKRKLWKERFTTLLNDDLNTAASLAVFWDLIKSEENPSLKIYLARIFNNVLGLSLFEGIESSIPAHIKELSLLREKARKEKNWEMADSFRKKVEEQGFSIEDTEEGPLILKK